MPDDVLTWLLDSDPSLRWQVQRDLAGEPSRGVTLGARRVLARWDDADAGAH